MPEDPGARRNRGNHFGLWMVLALLAGVVVLAGVTLFKPARQFTDTPAAETPLTTREQVTKDQAEFAASETARRQN